ncbi:DNA polymerase III subunits gamma and tau [bacterium BMS3Bbin04]|nr:DNA polymerase III subunits gamma and tau [bacterium BMS3Bbin04]
MDRAIEVGALLQRLGVEPDSFRKPRVRPDSPASQEKKTEVASSGDGSSSVATSPETSAANVEQVSSIEPEPAAEGEPEPQAETKSEPQVSEATQESVSDPEPVEEPAPVLEPVASDAPLGTEFTEQQPESEPDPVGGENVELDDDLTTEEPVSLSLSDIRTAWFAFCDTVEDSKRLLGAHLENGAPTGFEDGALEITFDPSCNFEYENVFKHRDVIARGFRSHFGEPARVVVKKGTVSDQQRPPKPLSESDKRREAFDEIRQKNPVWNEMIERFSLK